MSLSPRETAEKVARTRFIIMNVIRVMAIAMLLVGIAITRFAPYLRSNGMFGAALAAMGVLEFFFLPAITAKRFKALDRARDNHRK
ncbi:MAG: hypothetical protein HC870_03365 [Rhizobiales bacterium]|nr:hypothetical protein [Hyphomicrobiales bacterium]